MKYKKNLKRLAPIVVLVRPQLAQNIGMVARAMMNCGLSELRLVNPKQSQLSKEAISASSGAQSILEQAKKYNSLSLALSDVNYTFATTARQRDMVKSVCSPESANLKINQLLKSKQKVALIFGPERTGLENDDLILANAILSVNLNPVHPSLNLAQAVLLIGWSWWNSQNDVIENKNYSLASHDELEQFLTFLENTLSQNGYFQWADKKQRMINNMRNIFVRNELTSSEIKTLYRMIKKISGRKI